MTKVCTNSPLIHVITLFVFGLMYANGQPVVTTSTTTQLLQVSLMNTKSQILIPNLSPTVFIKLNETGRDLNILATVNQNVTTTIPIYRIDFRYDGAFARFDNKVPYTLVGQKVNKTYVPSILLPQLGQHSLSLGILGPNLELIGNVTFTLFVTDDTTVGAPNILAPTVVQPVMAPVPVITPPVTGPVKMPATSAPATKAPTRTPTKVPTQTPTVTAPVMTPSTSVPVPPSGGSSPSDASSYDAGPSGVVNGELLKWHKITIGFTGPFTSEDATPNPFTAYRLDVTFVHPASSTQYVVPGYYAADGNAANTGATSGNVWLVHFAPDHTGSWEWTASFTTGTDVILLTSVNASSAGYFDGTNGTIHVSQSNKTGRDLRKKGRLEYVGEHYLQFAETKEWFLKAGSDSPENFLAYADFDNSRSIAKNLTKTYVSHVQDYNSGDKLWNNGKGKGMIGAINYLSGMGMNVFSFLTFSVGGDDDSISMYTSRSDFLRIDVSKVSQWEVVFEHADKMGMYLHFKTQERENDYLMNNGTLGVERTLYYRELIARFGHHLALNWNLGEENRNELSALTTFIEYFDKTDPYKHPVVIHTWPTNASRQYIYGYLLGEKRFSGPSIQATALAVRTETRRWVSSSRNAGHKWIVTNDEQGSAEDGVVPDSVDPSHDVIRKNVLYGNLMNGGAGVEYYFGYGHACTDLNCDDYRTREKMWQQSAYALDFFHGNNVPFWLMTFSTNIITIPENSCMRTSDKSTVVVYLFNGGQETIDLVSVPTSVSYTVRWFDPITGGPLQMGSLSLLQGGGKRPTGFAPYNTSTQDWILLITKN